MDETTVNETPEKAPGKRNLRVTLRVVAFLTILVFALGGVSDILVSKTVSGHKISDFYDLRENSLDAVYIGSSRVYYFWNPLFAFRDHGITVFNLATAAQAIDMARFLIEEARKTQPNALMIVNLAAFHADYSPSLQRITDGMPFSLTKIRMVNTVSEYHRVRILDRPRFIFPLILYHSRWQELTEEDFFPKTGKYMSALSNRSYFTGHQDVSKYYPEPITESTPVKAATKAVLDELADYILENDIRVLFTLAPQAGISKEEIMERNGMRDYIRSRGCDVLDMQNKVEEIGLDLSTDYKDGRHTNVKGSAKFTEYLARYLIDHYGFTDKRNDPAYADWQTALTEYNKILVDPKNAEADGILDSDGMD